MKLQTKVVILSHFNTFNTYIVKKHSETFFISFLPPCNTYKVLLCTSLFPKNTFPYIPNQFLLFQKLIFCFCFKKYLFSKIQLTNKSICDIILLLQRCLTFSRRSEGNESKTIEYCFWRSETTQSKEWNEP